MSNADTTDDVEPSEPFSLVPQPDLPMPATMTPRGGGPLTAGIALEVFDQMLSCGSSPSPAFKARGIGYKRQYWERRANDGDDPFYTWLVTCLEIVESALENEVEAALYRKARFGSKDGMGDPKAMEMWLSRRSETYLVEKSGGSEGTGPAVSVTINQLLQLTQRPNDHTLQDLTGVGYDLLDADEPVQIEAKPVVKTFSFKRRVPVIEED